VYIIQIFQLFNTTHIPGVFRFVLFCGNRFLINVDLCLQRYIAVTKMNSHAMGDRRLPLKPVVRTKYAGDNLLKDSLDQSDPEVWKIIQAVCAVLI
jgi:hypothetical protein